MVRGLIAAVVIAVVLTVWTLVDAIMIPRHRVRTMPRWVWIVLIVLVPVVGPALWLLYGRAWNPRGKKQKQSRVVAPDDDPEFLRSLRVDKPEPETDADNSDKRD